MQNPRLAGRYAKSILDLAVEQKQLEAVYADMQFLHALGKASAEFIRIIKSPIINSERKQAVVNAVTQNKISAITVGFIKLLIAKNRVNVLPEIVHAFIEQYNTVKGIHKVVLTTAEAISDELKEAIVSKIKNTTAIQHIELETKIKPELVGGFVLEYNNNLVDASIQRDLKDLKKQFLNNDFVMKLR